MIFHSLTFTRSRGRCWKQREKPEIFNISRGTLRMLTNDTIMFDRYYCKIQRKHTENWENVCTLYSSALPPFFYALIPLFDRYYCKIQRKHTENWENVCTLYSSALPPFFYARILFINILDLGHGQVLFLIMIWRLSMCFAWRPGECINIIQ